MLVITIIIIITIIIKSSVIKDHLVRTLHYIQLWCWRRCLRHFVSSQTFCASGTLRMSVILSRWS